jgi:hypothetical protein
MPAEEENIVTVRSSRKTWRFQQLKWALSLSSTFMRGAEGPPACVRSSKDTFFLRNFPNYFFHASPLPCLLCTHQFLTANNLSFFFNLLSLTLYSTVVPIRTKYFNVHWVCICPQSIHSFHTIFRKSIDLFLNNIKQLIRVMVTCCVLSEVRIEFVNII